VIGLGKNSGLSFRPGDHLAVFPSNPAELVEDLLILLQVSNPDTYYSMIPLPGEEDFQHNLTSHPFTVREAFTDLLDITTPPKPELMEIFTQYALVPEEKMFLSELAKGSADYESWVQFHFPTISEVLQMFHISVPLPLLLEKLPRQQPRFYSISSSLKIHPGECHLTVGVVKYTTPSGVQHSGVSSNFLARSPLGTKVKVFVRPSEFSLPSSPSVPIVMVGPGTGIAPFRSFWQERMASKEPLGQAYLFFGCRTPNHYLYEDELQEAKQKGAITEIFTAFSRMGSRKNYVQNRIFAEKELICELITEQNAVIYICGDVRMSQDVEDAIKQVLQSKGMSILESSRYVENLMKTKRYLVDVFGNTLHVNKQMMEHKDRAMTQLFKTSSSSSRKQLGNYSGLSSPSPILEPSSSFHNLLPSMSSSSLAAHSRSSASSSISGNPLIRSASVSGNPLARSSSTPSITRVPPSL